MYYDLHYNNRNVSDFSCVAIKQANENMLGLNRELVKTELTSFRNKSNIFGTKYTDVLKLNFLIIKDPCIYREQNEGIFNSEEIREITSWLTSAKSPRTLAIDNEEGLIIEYYGVFGECSFFGDGLVFGINITFNCNAPYGYEIHRKKVTCTSTIETEIYNNTDELEEFVYPIITLTPNTTGEFSIQNLSTDDNTLVKVVLDKQYSEIIIDNDKRTVTADGKLKFLKDIGWNMDEITDWNNVSTNVYKLDFLKLVYGVNKLKIQGNGIFNILYKVPVKIGGY